MPGFDDQVVARRTYVRATAAAAMGGDAPAPAPAVAAHPMVLPLQMVMLDYDPRVPPGEWAELPEPFASTLQRLLDACADTSRCWSCGDPVGYITLPTAGDLAWVWTGLLWCPAMPEDPPNVLCEDCAPVTLESPADGSAANWARG